jgi:hypothetical protein
MVVDNEVLVLIAFSESLRMEHDGAKIIHENRDPRATQAFGIGLLDISGRGLPVKCGARHTAKHESLARFSWSVGNAAAAAALKILRNG